MMGGIVVFAYGLVAYAAFLATILYAIGFLGDFAVPKSVNDGSVGPVGTAVLVNVFLLALFAIQHTIMARPAFKERWTKIVPKPMERSTFVLLASAILALTFWLWRPIPTTVWHFDSPLVRGALYGISFAGWATVFYSSFLVDHFDLFGLRQVWLYLRGRPYTHPPLKTRSLYKWIRHPLMLGFIIAFWATPTMTVGHLVFAAVTTAYIFMGMAFEERDLRRILGEGYERYRERTPMLLPFLKRRRPAASEKPRNGRQYGT